jgi:hypothetical protein
MVEDECGLNEYYNADRGYGKECAHNMPAKLFEMIEERHLGFFATSPLYKKVKKSHGAKLFRKR